MKTNTTDTQVTKVKFLIEKIGNDVFAYFPDEIHSFNGYREDNRTCYAHIGQHSACHPEYAKECKEATKEQYQDLKAELESIGYRLKVLNKIKTEIKKCPVPEYSAHKIIKAIEKKIKPLEDIEKMEIADIINFHSCEASVIAEKTSELLCVSYKSIYDLL